MSSTLSEARRTSRGRLSSFVATAVPPVAALKRAAQAFTDTIGVILAGVPEPAARMVRALAAEEGAGPCRILGTAQTAGPGYAALANGVAAHALDFDDTSFIAMGHTSCVLVPAALAAAELVKAPGQAVLSGYVVGFEVDCRFGAVMNPRHYRERGWHCTSSIGTVGAAAAAARLLGLSPDAVAHALGIAVSNACGLKENLGSMVKPLHAGVAARNGLMAARLAQKGFVASEKAIDGPQGYLAVMDSEKGAAALEEACADLGSRWEILDTGVSVKPYPSCAGTHPPLDAILGLVRQHGFGADEVVAIQVEVDSTTPRLLIYDRPANGLEAKFSMPFCAAAAVILGPPTIDTFGLPAIRDPRLQRLAGCVTMRANPAFDVATPLSKARVTVRLRDGRELVQTADRAAGDPGRLTEQELATKFLGCAMRSLPPAAAERALDASRRIDQAGDISAFLALCVPEANSEQ